MSRILGAAWVALLLLASIVRAEPVPLAWGGDLRVRAEKLSNALDLDRSLNDQYAYYRLRSRLWVDAKPREGLRLYFRLGSEYRWGVFEKAVRSDGQVLEAASLRDPESRISLDNGWAEIGLPARTGMSFKFGRMDLPYGEGFLIFDGTPSDGSSSSYFDALMLTWRRQAASLDLFTAKIQDQGFGTPARDEDLYGIYFRRSPVEAYLLHRNKRGPTATTSGLGHPGHYTSALGSRFAHLPETGWHLVAEGAVEAGTDRNPPSLARAAEKQRRAWGGYLRGGWTSAGSLGPGLELGGTILSGDDPGSNSTRNEGWDGFYSEWPKYSELLVYALYDNTTRIKDKDLGTWTNLTALWLETRLKPSARIKASLRGTSLGAPQGTGPGGGLVRGLLLAGQINVIPAPGLEGQLLGETFDPGSFYAGGSDRAWYGRAQLTARF